MGNDLNWKNASTKIRTEETWNEYKARFEVCLYGQRLSL